MLRERNKRYETIKFVDISSDKYSPEENQGLDYKTVCYQIMSVLLVGVSTIAAFKLLCPP